MKLINNAPITKHVKWVREPRGKVVFFWRSRFSAWCWIIFGVLLFAPTVIFPVIGSPNDWIGGLPLALAGVGVLSTGIITLKCMKSFVVDPSAKTISIVTNEFWKQSETKSALSDASLIIIEAIHGQGSKAMAICVLAARIQNQFWTLASCADIGVLEAFGAEIQEAAGLPLRKISNNFPQGICPTCGLAKPTE